MMHARRAGLRGLERALDCGRTRGRRKYRKISRKIGKNIDKYWNIGDISEKNTEISIDRQIFFIFQTLVMNYL